MRLKGKTAIVTGASSGMGRDIAYYFAKEGANVLAVARRSEKLNELVKETKSFEGKTVAYSADITNKEKVEGMIDESIKLFGKLDILVNNAGIMDNMSGVAEINDEMWDKVMSLNVKSPFLAMRKAVNYFKEVGGGVIINVSSIGGLYGCRAGAVYTASKHAVVGLTKNPAFMYEKGNIRCNAICPGGIETEVGFGEFMKNINKEGAARCMTGIATNPRMGKGSEIATVAVFLASDDSSFINGQCIAVDGGWTAY
ncbi:glucose 1-dehydrogenase [Clostridium cylindrosporum]|uniref:3-oxoacyl-[acyl-carrier-protein] reductase FabG n=1 Tax=Clostridium cylindrosporum DSM 605 TaxID=1121307 RepID=A0A0J8D5E4_CLOCY|nr:glucose 1-dehydrogenase [Clostridium cylindrosporum]KMT21037.1 3-oxoacyl-[acyl-carrier-protein] reductase FabG [Clostridium cylindrosporum DSM 605]